MASASIRGHPLLPQRLASITIQDSAAAWDAAMRAGAFEAAWSVNDAVLAARDPADRDDPGAPYHQRWVWDGRPFDGRRVLVRCYHGLGDTLQFWRYLAPLRARAASLTVEVQPELLALLAGSPGPDRLVPFDPAHPAPPQECDIEIMELAHALRLRPPPAPYLHVPPMERPEAGPLIGLCWSAGGWDPRRSMPLGLLRDLPGCLISLQRGEAAAGSGLPDPLHQSPSVLRTAQLMMTLDAVVTVDTMVAHLAGALGRPTFLLLQHRADWRWMEGRSDSPWYPSMRLYRQAVAGEWRAPVARLRHDLQRAIGAGAIKAGELTREARVCS